MNSSQAHYDHCGPVRLGPWTLTLELVTPEMAASMLKSMNGKNRNVNKNSIKKYIQDTNLDRWMLTPVPIIICTDDDLGDGQHRLIKVVDTGKPEWFVIVRGADPEMRRVLDNGKARTAGDLFKIEDINSDASTVALHAYFYQDNPQGNWAAREPLNKLDHVEFAKANEAEISEALSYGKRANKAYRGFSASNFAFFYYQSQLQEVDKDSIAKFLVLLTGPTTQLEEGDPVAQLRHFCDNARGMEMHKAKRDRMGRVYWVLVSTFNQWATGWANGKPKKLMLPTTKWDIDDFYPSPRFGYIK
jgi:hypothetical protein